MSQVPPPGVTPERFAAALTGFAARVRGCVVLELSRMNRILSPGNQGIWPPEAPWSPSSNRSPDPGRALGR